MPNVKTAISIDKPIFDQMEMLAKQLKLSRSRLFTIAAREFIQRYKNSEILERLNEAYDDLSDPDPLVAKMRSKHRQIVEDQW